MANEACDSCDENGNILYQDPQVTPLGCYVFDNSSVIDTFNGLATLNSPKRPGLVFNDPYTYQIRMNVGHCLKRCIDFKFDYGALVGDVNCRCGYANALQSYIKDDDKKCNMYCTTATFTGNVTYPCGGKDAYTVYKAAVHYYTPPYNITLEEKLDIIHNMLGDKCTSSESMTIDECFDNCREGSDYCSASPGDNSQLCGGAWTLSLYEISAIPPNTSPTPSPIPPSLLNFTLTLKIVLGVCIPVFLIAVLIIVVIVYNRRCKTETGKTDEKYREELYE
ncbi:hypothetical protein RhiirA5_413877 [Rhizophagus irregularis]|uniref:WSC domain-containing protein n=2 Tax=Rhizophagus irregularis TaxID=588596 RepID=A0A2N0PVC8_9GLOM|nr:hypothetical protein RhiirA5_413877 [Rhizophagus irregularis]